MSLYRRISVHHFHVLEDQMGCCGCVPIGMGYHIIAVVDAVITVLVTVLAFYAFEDFNTDSTEKPIAHKYFLNTFIAMIAILLLCQIPRLVMYLVTLFKSMSYIYLKKYFRTRMTSFFILGMIMLVFFISIVMNISQLCVELGQPDPFTVPQILAPWGASLLIWLGLDLYWSISIRIYKDSKKGRRDEEDDMYRIVDNEVENRLSRQA